ncbi:MAG: ATP-binding cassette domain-containing protein [Rhizobiales bacterium]|nr:ATP-binding cassette domain-containing protein [Hyphomicrobiales bacterium]
MTVLDRISGLRTVETGSTEAEPTLSVRRLSKSFTNGPCVLSGVDIAIRPGESVALIGANGTGKSTFVRCLLRLIEPNDGDIRMFGLDVRALTSRSLRHLRSRVGFVFQRHNLVLRLSALSNVIHGAQARMSSPGSWYQALAPSRVRDEAMTCLERVSLDGKACARADSLSGGQSQRVAIARMLMQRPEFVIADEPDASLDPRAGEEIMRLLHETARERGLGLLFISHDLEHAIRFSDRIVGLAAGQVALDVRSNNANPTELRKFFAEERP